MAVPCASGVAAPKAGVGVVVAVSAQALQLLLESRGYRWVAAIAGIVPGFAIDSANFCGSGPPALPVLDATDAQALLNLAPWDELSVALVKVKDIALYYLWWDLCDCVGSATPQPSAPQTPVAITQPPTASSDPCKVTNDFTDTYNDPGGDHYRLAAELCWYTGCSFAVDQRMFPLIPRALTWTQHRALVGAAARQNITAYRIKWYTAGFAAVVKQDDWTAQGDDFEVTIDVPSGAVIAEAAYRVDVANSSDIGHGVLTAYCDQLPDITSQQGCCPPDPAVLAALERIVKTLDLVQRQAVPFAYVRSTVHTGLTGEGEIAVQGLIGALVTITGLPSWTGMEEGQPDVLFARSWLNWGNADGFSERTWLRTSPQLMLPAAAGQYTRIGYSLGPAVEISITELLREP